MALIFPANPSAQTPVNTFSPTSTPDASTNGATYIWNGSGWTGTTEGGEAPYLKLLADAGDQTVLSTGDTLFKGTVFVGGTVATTAHGSIVLNKDGDAAFSGKATSASTLSSDTATTLATKDYVDNPSNTDDRYLQLSGGKMTGAIEFASSQPLGDSTTPGILTLTNEIDNSSEKIAGSALAVKTAYDRGSAAQTAADACLPLVGGDLTGDVTSTSDITIDVGGFFVGDGSKLINVNKENPLIFLGTIDVTTAKAPSDPVDGDFYVNLIGGTADSSWTGLTTVVVNQFVFYKEPNWQAGGILDGTTFVTLTTDQTITSEKIFSEEVSFSSQVTVPATPTGNTNVASKQYADSKLALTGGTMTGDIVFASSQPTATTTTKGIIQLNDTVTSTSDSLAATAGAVKIAYDTAVAAGGGADNALPLAGGTMTGNIVFASSQPVGNGSTPGILTISDSVSATSSSVASSSTAVKTAYDRGTTGINNAATAQAAANAAQGTADTAVTNAATADAKAVSAQSTANTAVTNAATADAKAVSAQSTADTAVSNAATAQSAAVAAQSTANTAVSDAAAAQSTANAALPKTGGDISGNLNVSGTLTTTQTTASDSNDAVVTKGYVDTDAIVTSSSQTAAVNDYVVVSAAGQTITLPASPVEGQKVTVVVGGTFLNGVVARNGSNIMGLAEDLTMNIKYANVTFTYTNASQGWNIG